MEYVPGRDGFCEEDQIIRGKLPFPYSSSSSSSQYKGLFSPTQIYDNHHRQMGSWLGNKFVDTEEEDGSRPNEAAMDVSPENEDDGRPPDSEAAGTGNFVVEREHMFDKVVTPSDVGKLNRLVIPKQHAEKYFPLDSSSNEKGLLLNFEDRSGKPWRFRYSYWNSSQSYVMTKGWSRFVKEKKLDAGDVVSFQRGVGEIGKDRLYIDWRRRPEAPDPSSFPHHPFSFHQSHHIRPWSPLLFRPPPLNLIHHPYRNSYSNENGGRGGGGCYGYGNVVSPCSGSVIYVRSGAPQQVGMVQLQQGGVVDPSVPVAHGRASAKRLRLFGVNMECPISDSDDQSDILSSTSIPHASMAASQPSQLSPSSHPHLQLRLYNGTPLPAMAANDFLNKGKSSMSLDLDI